MDNSDAYDNCFYVYYDICYEDNVIDTKRQKPKITFEGKDIKDLLNISNDGLFEWKFSEFNYKFLNYFISRKDDEDDDIIHVKIINETS